MWDLGEEHDPLFLSAFCILSWFANLCTPLLFHSATNEVVAQTFYLYFILERNMITIVQTQIQMKNANLNV